MDSTRSVARRRTLTALAGTAVIAVAVQIPATAGTPTVSESRSGSSSAAQPFSAAADDEYYKDAEGKTGEELKTALNKIISTDATAISYDEVWDALKETDKDPDNAGNVILLYSGVSSPADNNGGGEDQWNREHTWAKSHGDFGTATGPGTDVHHLRPTNVKVNSTRGSKDFDEGGEEVEGAPGNFTDGDSFEPRDEVKGDVARMILYMDVRYEGTDDFPDLEANDEVENGSQPLHGKLSVLKKWNEADPPSDFEKNRNEVIFEKVQHNRNPFIDHPEWVNEIYK
ncbi:Endonuclease I [Streptomyces sp. WMMB 714]|uniref:endonuclease I family protein n=1 Tax=Streptomyces sp. WMMB 714 TaxID=1286822 RepID=UPI0005F7691D|nr:endonuclease [Streptomyces sp. WMMB 714]SCK11639.1 Endonuclease I [Streptomyces sp. WMMB 714]